MVALVPLNNQSPTRLVVEDATGDGLVQKLLEINTIYSDYEVRKEHGELLISELETIRDNIKDQGVSRNDMTSVESYTSEKLVLSPLNAYSQRPSASRLNVAMEEINLKQWAIIGGIAAAAAAVIAKVISWFRKRGSADGGVPTGGGAAKSTTKAAEDLQDKVKEATGKDLPAAVNSAPSDRKKVIQDEWTSLADRRTVMIQRCLTEPRQKNPAYRIIDISDTILPKIRNLTEILETNVLPALNAMDSSTLASPAAVEKIKAIQKIISPEGTEMANVLNMSELRDYIAAETKSTSFFSGKPKIKDYVQGISALRSKWSDELAARGTATHADYVNRKLGITDASAYEAIVEATGRQVEIETSNTLLISKEFIAASDELTATAEEVTSKLAALTKAASDLPKTVNLSHIAELANVIKETIEIATRSSTMVGTWSGIAQTISRALAVYNNDLREILLKMVNLTVDSKGADMNDDKFKNVGSAV